MSIGVTQFLELVGELKVFFENAKVSVGELPYILRTPAGDVFGLGLIDLGLFLGDLITNGRAPRAKGA